MKDKIDSKINSILEFVLSKPESEITMSDFEILKSEQRDLRFREEQQAQQERTAQLIALMGTPLVGHAYTEVKED